MRRKSRRTSANKLKGCSVIKYCSKGSTHRCQKIKNIIQNLSCFIKGHFRGPTNIKIAFVKNIIKVSKCNEPRTLEGSWVPSTHRRQESCSLKWSSILKNSSEIKTLEAGGVFSWNWNLISTLTQMIYFLIGKNAILQRRN